MTILILMVTAGGLVALFWYARRKEASLWNNGIAPNGEPWELIDREAQDGSRHYKSGTNEIWISYGVDNFKDVKDPYPY